jgi:site-specific recombinase XerD
MKPTDFSRHLTGFLSEYLPLQRNVSRNTIKSYRDAFKLLLSFCAEDGLAIEKVTMQKLSAERIKRFLQWLEAERNSSISTRNLRLTAIHSFFRYAQAESPQALFHYQQVLAIPLKKKRQAAVEHLFADGIRVLLGQPDRGTARGRRDLALLSLMYDSGARVQEIIDLAVSDFTTGSNPILVLTGNPCNAHYQPFFKCCFI